MSSLDALAPRRTADERERKIVRVTRKEGGPNPTPSQVMALFFAHKTKYMKMEFVVGAFAQVGASLPRFAISVHGYHTVQVRTALPNIILVGLQLYLRV